MVLVLFMPGLGRRRDTADCRCQRAACDRRRTPGNATGRRTTRRPAGKSASWRRTTRAARAGTEGGTARMTGRAATPRVVAGATWEALIEVARDALRRGVPPMRAVPIAPAPAVEDQWHGRAVDEQGW